MTKKFLHRQTLTLTYLLQRLTLICESIYFWSFSHVKVRHYQNIYLIFGHLLMFIDVNFSVMFKNFVHIQSVILIRSSEYSSNFLWEKLL